jgi:hypothetical protein
VLDVLVGVQDINTRKDVDVLDGCHALLPGGGNVGSGSGDQ